MEVMQCFGGQLSGDKYWCVSVGLVYRSVCVVLPSRITVVSRNVILSVEYSAVNFIMS